MVRTWVPNKHQVTFEPPDQFKVPKDTNQVGTIVDEVSYENEEFASKKMPVSSVRWG